MQKFWIFMVLGCLIVYSFQRSVAVDSNSIEDDEGTDNDVASAEPIASIKSRAIAMDRELCKKRSRYHPHYPRCQQYCENLKHWMGMCRRDNCHCYSL